MTAARTPHRCFLGMSGWNYDHWKGVFYPEHLPSSRWLEFYARHFDTVEINYSFYRLPARETFEKWRIETPDDFIFAVKASRYLTHMKKLKDPEEPLSRLMDRIAGLENKLGPILYQLPPHWRVNLPRLREFLDLLPAGLRHVMEFRDSSWQTEDVYRLLEEHGVGYCIMSAPGLPLVMRTTATFAYIRMHSGGPDTGYSEAQLRWWSERVLDLQEKGDVYIYFNNDYRGYAVQNAERLRELIATPAFTRTAA